MSYWFRRLTRHSVAPGSAGAGTPCSRPGTSRSSRCSGGRSGPCPRSSGSAGCSRAGCTHVTKLVIAVCEIRPRNAPPTAAEAEVRAAGLERGLHLRREVASPRHRRRHAAARPSVVPVPVPVPLPLALPAPPGGGPEPAGRAGRVTPCDFRHETSCARRALLAPPPAAAAEDASRRPRPRPSYCSWCYSSCSRCRRQRSGTPAATMATQRRSTRRDPMSNNLRFNTASFRK